MHFCLLIHSASLRGGKVERRDLGVGDNENQTVRETGVVGNPRWGNAAEPLNRGRNPF